MIANIVSEFAALLAIYASHAIYLRKAKSIVSFRGLKRALAVEDCWCRLDGSDILQFNPYIEAGNESAQNRDARE